MNWILRSSVVLNLALLTWAGLLLRPDSTPPFPPASTGDTAVKPGVQLDYARPAAGLPSGQVNVTNPFCWTSLESTNYQVLAANLRAVRCPEATIRDIIFADAERRYAQLDSTQVESIPFWVAGRERAAITRRNEQNRSDAQTALMAELKNLFGVDWYPDEDDIHRVEVQALSRLMIGPVSDQQFDQIWRWFVGNMQLYEVFRRERQNLLLAADHESWRAFVRQREAELKQSIGPIAFEEFQARSALVEALFDSEVGHFEHLALTPLELRQLSLLKAREVGWLEEVNHLDEDESPEEKAARVDAFAVAAKQVLSPEHYEEYLRVQDGDYRRILNAVVEGELPRTVAVQVYQVYQLASAEYHRLQTFPDDVEAMAAAAALQETTEQSVRSLLGDEVFEKFTTRDGKWVRDLNRL